jgi:phage shock protein A
MGIFSRMGDIINANINALLDSAEDPEKMIRLIIQEMEDTLVEVRTSSARVLADRKATARRLATVAEAAADWERKAKLAIEKGREDLARAALQERRLLEEDIARVNTELEVTDEQISQLNDEIGQLQSKLNDAKAKQKSMLMRAQTVNSRVKVKQQVHRTALDDAFSKFERFERRLDNAESELDAMDIGRSNETDLASEIEALEQDEWLDKELERLKEDVGKTAQ